MWEKSSEGKILFCSFAYWLKILQHLLVSIIVFRGTTPCFNSSKSLSYQLKLKQEVIEGLLLKARLVGIFFLLAIPNRKKRKSALQFLVGRAFIGDKPVTIHPILAPSLLDFVR